MVSQGTTQAMPSSAELAQRLISLRVETRETKRALRLAQSIEAAERERASRSEQHAE